MLVDEVQREQRVPQVVEHAHEQHDVEALVEPTDLEHRQLAQLDVDAADLGGEAGLREVALVAVDAEHALGATALHLDGIEAAVAADVEDGAAGRSCGMAWAKCCHLNAG